MTSLEQKQKIQAELSIFWNEIANALPKSIERSAFGDERIFNAFATAYPAIREYLYNARTQEVLEILIKEGYLKGDKVIPHDDSKKSHGTCCYCGTCGHDNDYCVCSHNDLIKSLSPEVKDDSK